MQQFWHGIVEDFLDPKKLYRYKVRVFGIHTENKIDDTLDDYLPTEDLPWALSMTNGSGLDEEGEFKRINPGSHVIVSFLDPEKQKPIIFGTLPRYVIEKPDFEEGFSDPDEIYPKTTHLEESSISRLARNEKIDETIIQTKKDEIKTNVDCGSSSWSEPQTQYNAEYPLNRVIQTKNHIFEMDDTEGVERIHVYHKTGSSKEYHPNGDKVDITKRKKYTIVISDDNILIEGNQNIRIQGTQNVRIDGNRNKDIHGNQNIDIDGNQTVNIGGTQTLTAVTEIDMDAAIINLN